MKIQKCKNIICRRKYIVKCNYCLEDFSPWNNLAKFCSRKCSNHGKKKSIEEIFRGNIILPANENDCWLYKSITNKGYGSLKINKKTYLAHRYSWELHHYPIPDGLCVCHHCDVRNCVNPDHLFLGTRLTNYRDMIQKNRSNQARGSRVNTSKLTEEDIINIRLRLQKKELVANLAEEYNVTKGHIYHIRDKISWKHI